MCRQTRLMGLSSSLHILSDHGEDDGVAHIVEHGFGANELAYVGAFAGFCDGWGVTKVFEVIGRGDRHGVELPGSIVELYVWVLWGTPFLTEVSPHSAEFGGRYL